MPEIRTAFWNLGNLFDTAADPIANDFDFRPDNGWVPETKQAKIANLASVIDAMFDGEGPDLLGICEVENESTLQQLIDTCDTPRSHRTALRRLRRRSRD